MRLNYIISGDIKSERKTVLCACNKHMNIILVIQQTISDTGVFKKQIRLTTFFCHIDM